MSLMIMKGSITPAIRGAIPDSDNAMSYIKSVEEQFLGTSKSLASTLMIKMITMKYDGHSGVREHIMKMSDMASQLKGIDMAISKGFLVHFIMTSLPSQFGPFKINYNTQKDKWKMSELIAMCVQEEERLKVEKPDMAHLTIVDIPPNSWWIDTGASIHITNSLQRYLTSKRLSKGERTITLGNGTEVEIEAIGKYTKVKKKGASRATELLECIHSDIWGPYSILTINGHKYFISFIDDFSRFTESGQHLSVFALFLREHGIIANHTMPGTPKQNGVAKRRNRTLIDMGPKIVETRHAVFLENQYFGGGTELKKLTSNEVSTLMMEYSVTQEVSRNEKENVPTTEVSLRRSQREKRPAISNDYEVYLNECDYDVGLESDPTSYGQAINSENSTLWLYAMEEELKSMKDNEVWNLVELPKEIKTIGCKWIYKTKHDSKGKVERYKARLVAIGYTQKEGIDYKETFSPVSKKDSLRIVMALVAHFDLELHQMDVKTAFLNGDLHEEVYMDQPEGFQVKGKAHMNLVDQCIYLKISGSKICIIVLYVDDMLLASNYMGMILETKQFLSKNFDMKDLGEASYVIGIEIHRDRSRGLSQKNYIEKVLKRLNMQNCSSSVAAIVKGDIFCELQCPKNDLEKKQMDKIPYASAVGSIMYAQVCTRPDIAYVVGMLGRYQSNPGIDH
ncbi:Retrovirus-related Pol polyprotein from transposon TNT 1-94 [Vitis vinifera]|uniref:Retrovirus-related Pol polyprotein from transposon TNT 1-94 n=1 Tax=Vitis vinifera TaxID=29760 RepID=A0A438GLZ4_VITVI|nr:Retrovirus-related Pol polyprotein from transposon TNT 1-94 [Vitis vinifera]